MILGLLVLLATAAAWALLRLWPAIQRHRRRLAFARTLPGPTLFDLIRATRRGRILDWLLANRRQYGDIYCLWFGPDLVVHTVAADLVRTILTSNELTHKAKGYDMVRPWLGNGLLTNGGESWHQKRKLLTPAFHFQILGTFKEPMEECCDTLVERLRRLADGRTEVDVYRLVTLFALDVICETAMGIKVNAQVNQESEFVQATQKICRIFHRQHFSTWKRIPSLFALSADGKASKQCLRILHAETRRVIQLRRAQLANTASGLSQPAADPLSMPTKRRLAFLDSLLLTQRDHPDLLSDANIQEEVDTFMFEGHDTTSSAISFALFLLSQHPREQELAWREVHRLDAMQNANQTLPYLEAVIKETLRLYPSVPSYSRQTHRPFQLTADLCVPTGVTISVMAYVVHRDPVHYPQPDRFWPERWLPEAEEARPAHPYAHIAFSAGPRNCIGQRFALLELKCTLSRMLREFEWLPVRGFVPATVPELVLKSSNGLLVRVQPRAAGNGVGAD